MNQERTKLWIFVNHLGEFRYVLSNIPPQKYYVFDKVLDHTEEFEPYHGSHTFIKEYYRYSEDKKIWYYGYYPKVRATNLPTDNKAYFEPEIIGTLVPKELIREEYLSLTFEDNPVLIERNDERNSLYAE